MRPTRKKRFTFVLMAIGLGAVLSLLALEIALRGFERYEKERNRPTQEELNLLQPNPEGTGSYRLQPNLSLQAEVGRYTVEIKTNSHGMRWREVSRASGGRLKRVAFFGDSFTFGCWADSVENSLVGVFEQNVSPERWEVLNFGVGGYGPADVELLLEEGGISFAPSYVILVLFVGNDLRDTYLGPHKDIIVNGTAVLDEDLLKRVVPERFNGKDRTTSRPAEDPSAFRKALQRFATWRFLAPHIRQENLAVEFGVNSRFISYSFWSQHPYPEIARRARDETLRTLARINDSLIENNIKLGVVALPTRDQVYSRRTSGPNYDINFPQTYVRVFARENHIPFLDLLPVFRAHVQRTNERIYVEGDTHLNNEGHYLAGWQISEWFRCCLKNQPLVWTLDESILEGAKPFGKDDTSR